MSDTKIKQALVKKGISEQSIQNIVVLPVLKLGLIHLANEEAKRNVLAMKSLIVEEERKYEVPKIKEPKQTENKPNWVVVKDIPLDANREMIVKSLNLATNTFVSIFEGNAYLYSREHINKILGKPIILNNKQVSSFAVRGIYFLIFSSNFLV